MLLGFLLLYAGTGTFDMAALARNHGHGLGMAPSCSRSSLLLVGFARQEPDVAAAHLAAGRAHRGADGRLRAAGRRAAEDGHLRFRAHRRARPSTRRPRRCAGTRHSRRRRHHLRLARLLGLATSETADLKRLIAFSSVGHMGFVLLGIATLTTVGIQGALFGNVAHGVITGLLFFLVGGIKDRFHTSSFAELGGGLLAKTPALAGLIAVRRHRQPRPAGAGRVLGRDARDARLLPA